MDFRELEKKYRVTSPSNHVQLEDKIKALGCFRTMIGLDVDTYWALPDGATLRYRFREGTGERWLTYKKKDKGTNVDRLEIQTEVGPDAVALVTALYGEPTGVVEKSFTTFTAFPDLEIAIYTVVGDSTLFLEVESKGGNLLSIERMEGHFIAEDIEFTHEPKSIYELFIQKEAA